MTNTQMYMGYSFNNVITELKDGLYSCTLNKLLYLRNGAI